MFTRRASRIGLGLLLLSVSGCVAVSRTDGFRNVQQRVAGAASAAPTFADQNDRAAGDARVAELLAVPLTAPGAVQVAFLRNPLLLEASARLALSQADVVAASRIANPVLSGSVIAGAGERQVIGGIGQSFTDVLLLSARKRLASGEYARAQQLVAASLLDLIRDTEAAWYRYVSAEQVSAMRQAVARSAQASATLAERFFEAGNISELELALDRTGASQAQLATLRAAADARAAKYELQKKMGLAGDPAWRAVSKLPAPTPVTEAADPLVTRAHDQRADIVAARQEVALLADAVHVATRWRWLGSADLGLERERGTDGRVLTGPTLALALPIFNQGQAGIARAEAQLEQGRARLSALEAAADHAVRFGLERLAVARQVAEEYRLALVPQQELIVKRQQELQNFMFIGQFELLLSKQQQYEAYQGYLEAVRDFWLARVDLARAVGADLPQTSDLSDPAVGVDAILRAPTGRMDQTDHSHYGSHPVPSPSETGSHEMQVMPGMTRPADEPRAHDASAPNGDHP